MRLLLDRYNEMKLKWSSGLGTCSTHHALSLALRNWVFDFPSSTQFFIAIGIQASGTPKRFRLPPPQPRETKPRSKLRGCTLSIMSAKYTYRTFYFIRPTASVPTASCYVGKTPRIRISQDWRTVVYATVEINFRSQLAMLRHLWAGGY